MDSAIIVALVSVIGTVVVSIVSVIVPTWFQWRKSKQEKIAAEREKIRESAADLFRHLANFRFRALADIEGSAGVSFQQAYSEVRASEAMWEVAVFSRLVSDERETIRRMRLEEFGKDRLGENVMQITDEAVRFTQIALERVK